LVGAYGAVADIEPSDLGRSGRNWASNYKQRKKNNSLHK